MPLRACLIDAAEQKISPLQFPNTSKDLTLQALRELIGAGMQFAWITHETKVAYCEEGNGAAFCRLPGSPPIAKAVILDCEDGEYRDLSMTLAELAARIQWGEAAPLPSRERAPNRIGPGVTRPDKRQTKGHGAHRRQTPKP